MVRSVFKSWNWRTRISKVFGSEMNKSFPESPAIITSFLFLLRYARRPFTSPASPLGDTFLSPSDSAHAMHGRTEGLGDLPVLPSSSGAGEGGGSLRVSSRGSPRAGGRARPSEIPMGQGIRNRTSGGGGAEGHASICQRRVRMLRTASDERAQGLPPAHACVAS